MQAGRTARIRGYDRTNRRFGGVREMREIPPAPVVLAEGVGAGRRAPRPHLATVLWLDMARDTARALGELRDGPAPADFWTGWARAHRTGTSPKTPHAPSLIT